MMKPLLRCSVSLWSILVFSALLKISQAQCPGIKCSSNETETFTTTTTTVTFGSRNNCTLSIINQSISIPENGSTTGLIPGAVYQISSSCLNCCTEATTKPGVVRNLTVTNITTSSIFLTWTKPDGNSSSYRVQWTGGNVTYNDSVTLTQKNITNLTAGVQYNIIVTAVADDGITEGEKASVSQYTKPNVVRNLSVSNITTSSISLTWTKPEGNSSSYRVQWTDGTNNWSDYVTDTDISVTGLTAGVQYNLTVLAVAGDNTTLGDAMTMSLYTKPNVVRNLNVSNITTSSIFLTWTKPEGNSSSYRVQWTDGTNNWSDYVTDTDISVTGLTAGVQYNLTVLAVAGDNTTLGDAKTLSLYTKPNVVRNLSVSNITTSSIFLTWTKPEGNSSSYRVQWTDGTNNWSDYVTDTDISVTGLTAGVQYNLTVLAVAGDNTTLGDAKTLSLYTKPNVVRNLSVTNITTSSIFLTWTKPEGNSSSYRVQWTDGTNNWSDYVTDTNISVTGLTAGVQYNLTVLAVAGDNTTLGDAKTMSLYTKPNVVRNLNVSNITTSSISLTWTKPEGNSSSYRVQWTDGTNNWSDYVTDTNISVTGLTAGVQYNLTVLAVAGDNTTLGEAMTMSLYTKPNVVRNLNVTNITTSSIFLTWTIPEGNSSSYRVQWTGGNVTDNESVTLTQQNITNLTAGVQYNIVVTAVAGDGSTEGQRIAIFQYTRPGKIGELTVSTNTSSISLNWTSPPGAVFTYKVKWHNDVAWMSRYTNSTFAVLSDLIPGTNYIISIVAIAGDNHTEGECSTFSSVTKPEVVRNLTVTNITTSSIFLTWAKPEGNSSSYRVQWTGGNVTDNDSVPLTQKNIINLTAGVQYKITVTAVAGDGSTVGQSTSVSQYTRPEKPVNITITAKGTYYLNISWTLPAGTVDDYVVNISNERHTLYSNITAVTTALFTDLYPGRIFFITVTAVAGNFSEMSDQFAFATDPTPPGSIIFSQRTNSSLSLKWATPALMEYAPNISYYITYQPANGTVHNISSLVNSTALNWLLSGTSYNITVQTVGPMNLWSTVVYNSTYTLPNPVLNLVASPSSTTSVKVTWSYPQGAQMYYKYLVQTYSTAGPVFNTPVSINNTNVPNLEPGTGYNISVTTIAATGSESTVENTFSYTMPKAVTNLTVANVNTMAIQLTWLRQSDHKPSYTYLVMALQNATVVQNDTTETETYTFFNLTPGTFYSFEVFTVVEGVMSAVENTSSYTKPAAVTNIIAIGSTTTMLVSWTPAFGQVDSYTVYLFRGSVQLVKNSMNPSNTTVTLQGLTPGVVYCTVVVTKSGPFENNNSVCNATFPNPPGPIMVTSQTVESINFTWPFPNGMDSHQYNFSVSSINGSLISGNNWFLLDNLQSGSLYRISVVTEGVLNYRSTAVTTENYTRPYPVTNLTTTNITTNAVTLVWDQPESKPNYLYLVQTTNSYIFPSVVDSKKITISGLLSGSNYSFTVTTQTPDGTKADPVPVSYFTRPYGIGQLEAETLNTTAVSLNWTKPLEYKPEYTYWVRTIGCGSQNQTVLGEVAVISELPPGTNCTFCVFVRAANGIKGEANCTSQYTKPEAVQPRISSQGSSSSILVSWTTPPGKVERYMVSLNSSSFSLNSTSTSFLFGNLSAGRLYTAMVTTYSGPFSASSGFITNATFPNPPGPIEILSQTTSSIDVRWKEAPLMDGASFYYQLTKLPAQGGENITTSNTSYTSYTFGSLLSGTPYNFSVATVGAMGFQSESVQIYMVTTRPFCVKILTTSTKEESITVMWNEPDEYKESYRYHLTWRGSDGTISNITIKEIYYTVNNLVPGSSYDFNVTTVTSDGTESAPRRISICTNASPVTNLTCLGPNTTNAEILLSWTKPNGQNLGFQVTGNNIVNNVIKTCCNYTVSNLRHYTGYNLTVVTQSCGLPSTPRSLLCITGITNPLIPVNYKSLVVVTSTAYNKFTLQIDPNLLDSTSGPITQVGVLVTNNFSGNSSDSLAYVGATYDQWKARKTLGYMATVSNRIQAIQTRSVESYLIIEVGDESTWNGYTNGALDATGHYQFAIVLFTKLTLDQNNLVNVQLSLLSPTKFYNTITLPQNPAVVTGIAVGATLGIFCILFIILIVFIIHWKRISTKESPDIQIHSMRAKVSVAVRVEDYEAYYKKQKADSNCGFAEEFEDLKLVGTAQSKTHALMLENKPKNRYNNVLPYDSSRVKLSIIHGSPYDDYINANYMPGYDSRKEYIAAQGPLPSTVNEFWRMIWEKNVQTLVMLTRCNEQGRVKCEQYWDHGTKHFENITVTTTSVIPLEDWTIRDFNIKNVKTAETRSVRHFHFTAWPDHGVPQTTELLISFRHLVREHMDQYSRHSPTVVHCSAGVGRTGTFIAIDRLIFQIERENIVDVYGIVHDQRMHRPLMVQTEDQYVFLNQCAMDIIRSRTGTNVDLIYQNTAALSIYENIEPKKKGYPNA
ncbi:receptor-type tyrosine-protein phosphatase eta isoform X4 [Perca fluviatilis]|uniref:receptor-type tyrosine-protein phosphatase eta isoform X4 n=1 Tax=Perca fluviatilis TaxID=8168 RepID=UPI001962B41F|nr:receptor-type tyrosine-protein phosphatase eta isoform X4 [Perca fluviatilis]